ncbi:uncharacterized protein LOC133745471 [Rosa rugosa]|uniref:uncharacterized protein LOC133745471 n=1 Tax=Rosa rugosa TaxID=74645 RepID=UPI002B413644|nr:uncharacterized protein LOC133727763 isoform X2 [Rosa rugosa]XP_062029508.1 uncharacterized protein LOC133745451 isoform X2 [Rosa rugosa]XP_062029529.1 uncharacterized protein LOC133745471 [Rosa rugosa]
MVPWWLTSEHDLRRRRKKNQMDLFSEILGMTMHEDSCLIRISMGNYQKQSKAMSDALGQFSGKKPVGLDCTSWLFVVREVLRFDLYGKDYFIVMNASEITDKLGLHTFVNANGWESYVWLF